MLTLTSLMSLREWLDCFDVVMAVVFVILLIS